MPLRRDIRAAIEAIRQDAWTPITYPRAIWDENQQRLISDAQITEVPYTAFVKKEERPRDHRAGLRGLERRAACSPALRALPGQRGLAHPGRHHRQPDPRGRRARLPFHARARGATIRAGLITVAARIARHGRGRITLHLPEAWHREAGWMNLFEAAWGPPLPGAA